MNKERIIGVSDVRRFYEVMRESYKVDYSYMASTSLKRRIEKFIELENIGFDAFLDLVKKNDEFHRKFLNFIRIKGTELFRDPSLWRMLRDKILPDMIAERGIIKIWIPDVSTSEDLFSLLILLQETNLRSKVIIEGSFNEYLPYDLNNIPVYPHSEIEISAGNYKRFNEKSDFMQYVNAVQGGYTINNDFLQGFSLSTFNFVNPQTPASLYDITLCRNILIYYSQPQHDRLLTVFLDALVKNGLLILGHFESIAFCRDYSRFTPIYESERIFKKN